MVVLGTLLIARLSLRAAEDLSAVLQRGLLEEEANQNLPAAIDAYQALLGLHERDRKLAATAIFRLGECYRKLGRTNEAVAQYQRIVSGYGEHTNLVTLSRQNLAGLGAGSGAAPTLEFSRPAVENRAGGSGLEAMRGEWLGQITLYESLTNRPVSELAKILPTIVSDPLLTQRLGQLESLQAREMELRQSFSDDHPESRALHRQIEVVARQVDERVDGIRKSLGVKAEVARRQLAAWPAAGGGSGVFGSGFSGTTAGGLTLPSFPPGYGTNLESGTNSFAARLAAISNRGMLNLEDLEIQRIQQVIKNSPDLINAFEADLAPLHKAARDGQVTVARFLLDNGAQIDIRRPNDGWTPLALACDAGHKAMAELLLDRGANPNATLNYGRTVLHIIAVKGYLSILDLLLRRGAAVDARANEGGTPLHAAIAAKQRRSVERLLEAKAGLEVKDNEGRTPLYAAARALDRETVEQLLARGANIDARDKNNLPPLGAVLVRGSEGRSGRVAMFSDGRGATADDAVKLANLLLDRKATVDFATPTISPLHLALGLGSTGLVQRMIGLGLTVNPTDQRGLTPLQAVVCDGLEAMFSPLLVKAGAHPGAPLPENLPFLGSPSVNVAGETPLVAAIEMRRSPHVEALLQAGARVELPNPGNAQPNALFPAIYTGDPTLVDLVLRFKPDLSVRRVGEGLTALHVAVSNGRTNIVQALLAAGAPVNAFDAYGRTPLFQACERVDLQTAQLLLQAGADPNLQDGRGRFPLEVAMSFVAPAKTPEAVRRLGSVPGAAPYPPVPGVVPPANAPPSVRAEELVALLRQHGAEEKRLRQNTIIATRSGRNISQIVYRRGTNDFNRHQLYELMLDVFARDDLFAFPDLTHVVIYRLLPDGSERAMPVDLDKALPYGPVEARPVLGSEYQWLEWGDRVEIPEAEHPISMKWSGFDLQWAGRLVEGLDRTVDLIANQRTNRFQLRVATGGPGLPRFPFSHDSFRLHEVLLRSKLFQGTDGLSVRVTRKDPLTQQPKVYEFTDANRPLVSDIDLWVRHGDVIEVR